LPRFRRFFGSPRPAVAKIPGGSLVDASGCDGGWCEIAWQDKKGFAIQSALDMSGRVPQQRAAAVAPRPGYRQGPEVIERPKVVEGPVYYDPPAVFITAARTIGHTTARTGAGGVTGGDGYFA